MSIVIQCSKHPTYKAKRPPQSACDACWDLWHLHADIRDGMFAFEIVAEELVGRKEKR